MTDNTNQWWTEKDSEHILDGKKISVTEFEWPQDRLIVLRRPKPDMSNPEDIQVATLHKDLYCIGNRTLDDVFRIAAAEHAKDHEHTHLHIIHVKGTQDYGITADDQKCFPVVNFWENSEQRRDYLMARRKKAQTNMDAYHITVVSDSGRIIDYGWVKTSQFEGGARALVTAWEQFENFRWFARKNTKEEFEQHVIDVVSTKTIFGMNATAIDDHNASLAYAISAFSFQQMAREGDASRRKNELI